MRLSLQSESALTLGLVEMVVNHNFRFDVMFSVVYYLMELGLFDNSVLQH